MPHNSTRASPPSSSSLTPSTPCPNRCNSPRPRIPLTNVRLRFTMQTPTSGFDKYGYSVVHTNCLSNFSHIHEIGHNMGANHDKENSQSSHAYAHAHRYCDGSKP